MQPLLESFSYRHTTRLLLLLRFLGENVLATIFEMKDAHIKLYYYS